MKSSGESGNDEREEFFLRAAGGDLDRPRGGRLRDRDPVGVRRRVARLPSRGIIILLAGTAFVALARWPRAPAVGAFLGLFVTIGFLISPTGWSNLTCEARASVAMGQAIQVIGVLTAVIAGVVARRANYRKVPPASCNTATYTRLAQECRNVAGLIGDGRKASADGAILLSRLRKVPSSQPLAPEQAKSLVRLFNRIDARVSEIIEKGIAERLYLLRLRVPRLSNDAIWTVRRVRQRYVPITPHVQTDLLRLAHDLLRPAPSQPIPPPGATQSRRKFQEAILHRPRPRGDPPRLA